MPNNSLETVLNHIKTLNNINLDELKKKATNLGMSLDTCTLVAQLIEVTKELQDETILAAEWQKLPTFTQQGIQQELSKFVNAVSGLKNLTVNNNSDAAAQLKHIQNQIQQAYDRLYKTLSDLQQSQIIHKMQSDREEISKILKEVRANKEGIKKVRKAESEVLADASTLEHSRIFTDQADVHQKAANRWLFVTIIAVMVIGYVAWRLLLREQTMDAIVPNHIHMEILSIATRIFILSVLSVILFAFLKNYNANKHLNILNRHRANCMKSINAFFLSAKGEKTQDAILEQAVTEIFKAGETGYLHKCNTEGTQGIGAIKIVENLGNK